MKVIFLALLLCIISGCVTTPKKPSQPVAIINPAKGNAAIYIFRSELDQIRKSDSPELFIDGKLIAQLPHASYTRVELPIGKHSLKLSPKKKESAIWNTEAVFEVTQEDIYFVAIWNSNQPRKAIAHVPIVIPGLLGLLPIYGAGSGMEPGAAFEAVNRETGEFSLTGLIYIPAH